VFIIFFISYTCFIYHCTCCLFISVCIKKVTEGRWQTWSVSIYTNSYILSIYVSHKMLVSFVLIWFTIKLLQLQAWDIQSIHCTNIQCNITLVRSASAIDETSTSTIWAEFMYIIPFVEFIALQDIQIIRLEFRLWEESQEITTTRADRAWIMIRSCAYFNVVCPLAWMEVLQLHELISSSVNGLSLSISYLKALQWQPPV